MPSSEPGAPAKCRSCGADVVWTVTVHGKKMPCDRKPSDNGDFFLFRRKDHIAAVHKGSKGQLASLAWSRKQRRYTSHFSTCPNAGDHRKS